MKHFKVEQRSEAWHKLRLGIPTASGFKRLLTPKGKASTQCDGYLNELIAERILGRPLEFFESEFMRRGTELEDEAIRAYEFHSGVETEPAGFWTLDDGLAGASPDRLVGPDGILEIKCPAAHTHVAYMRSRHVEEEYRPQLQGQLWITERRWVDVCSYCPGFPPVALRVVRDEDYIRSLAAVVGTFTELLLSEWLRIESAYGPFTHPEPEAPQEVDPFEITMEDCEAILQDQERKL